MTRLSGPLTASALNSLPIDIRQLGTRSVIQPVATQIRNARMNGADGAGRGSPLIHRLLKHVPRRSCSRVLWLYLCAGLSLQACEPTAPAVAELHGRTMGTGYSVLITPPPTAALAARLQGEIAQRLEQIDQQMSTYRADSDLMRFNRSQSTAWQAVPGDVARLVERAATISRASDGLYDVTAGPLVNLWGFGNSGRRDHPPSAGQIASLLPHVGHEKLQVRISPPALRKQAAQLQIDLSSIAKGWAVDELANLLDSAGIANYLVEIGGELRARGRKQDESTWQVAIERPSDGARRVHRAVALIDAALATSGDYRNYFTADDKRYAHTIDPRSGHPVRHRLASVSVIAANCTDADAWATALLAMGEDRGLALAQARGLRALFLVRDGDRFIEYPSTGWPMADAQVQAPPAATQVTQTRIDRPSASDSRNAR